MKHVKAGLFEVTGRVLQAKLRWKHPFYLIHSLTSRCNAKCGFCAWTPDEGADQLTTAEIKKLYCDARREGFVAVSFWGGEPLLRRDAGEIFRCAARLGFRTSLVTNGALLERKLNDVVPYVDKICISVDHPSERHDEFRGIPGLFGAIVDATRKIKKAAPKKEIVFNYTLQKHNTDAASLEKMAELTRSLGVTGVYNALRVESASRHPGRDLKAFDPEPEALREAFGHISRLKRRGFPVMNSRTHIDMMRQGPPVYRCHWPKFMLPIEANGDVVDCMRWGTRPIDNIRKTSFANILKSPRLRELGGKAGESCHKCVSLHRVEVSEIWSGNLEPLLSWRKALTN